MKRLLLLTLWLNVAFAGVSHFNNAVLGNFRDYTSILGLKTWLDCSSSGNTVVSSKFSQLTDKSGTGSDFTQSNAGNRITKNSTGQNGLATCTFTHGVSGGINANHTYGADIVNWTYCFSHWFGTSTANDGFLTSSSPANNAVGLEVSNDNAFQLAAYVNAHGTQANTGRGSHLAEGLGGVSCYVFDGSGPSGKWYVTNKEVGKQVQLGSSSVGPQTFFSSHQVNFGNVGTNTITADVGDGVLYDRALPQASIYKVMDFMESRWGITPFVDSNPASVRIFRYDFSGTVSTRTTSGSDLTQLTDGASPSYGGTLITRSTTKPQVVTNCQNGHDCVTMSPNNTTAVYMTTADPGLSDIHDWTWVFAGEASSFNGDDQMGGSYTSRCDLTGYETGGVESGSTCNTHSMEAFKNCIIAAECSGNNSISANTPFIAIHTYESAKASNNYTATGQWYINGVAAGSAGHFNYMGFAGNKPFGIGSDASGVGTWKGKIFEQRLYNYTMNSSQAATEDADVNSFWVIH